MFKKLLIPTLALLALLILIPPPQAQARVSIGFGIGVPAYPAYPAPYYGYYGYPYSYPYVAPAYPYGYYGYGYSGGPYYRGYRRDYDHRYERGGHERGGGRHENRGRGRR